MVTGIPSNRLDQAAAVRSTIQSCAQCDALQSLSSGISAPLVAARVAVIGVSPRRYPPRATSFNYPCNFQLRQRFNARKVRCRLHTPRTRRPVRCVLPHGHVLTCTLYCPRRSLDLHCRRQLDDWRDWAHCRAQYPRALISSRDCTLARVWGGAPGLVEAPGGLVPNLWARVMAGIRLAHPRACRSPP